MIKKGIAVAAILAGTSGLAFAGGPEVAPAPAYVGGFYLGVGLSRDDARTEWRHERFDVDNADVVTPANYRRIDSGATGWDGQLMFGYGHVWDNEYYLGAEVWGDYSNNSGMQLDTILQTASAYTRTTSNFTAPWTFGIALLPGYYAAPGSLFYVRLAYLETQFNIYGNIVGSGNGISALERPRATWENFESGFQFGVGTDTQVGNHVSVREEYVWQTYGKTSRTVTSAAVDGTRWRRNTSIDPTMENFNFALIYRFAAQSNAPDLAATPTHVGGHFYAGLAGSRDNVFTTAQYFNTITSATAPIVPPDSGFTYSSDGGLMKFDGWDVQGLLGYGYNLTNRWYVGLEIFGDWANTDGKFRLTIPDGTGNITNKLERQWSYGIAVTPGYQVSDHALLYTRVGFISGYFKTSSNFTNPVIAGFNRSRSRWLAGVQLGVGVDTLVYENLSLRTEFDFNNYGRFRSMSPTIAAGNAFHNDEANYKDICEDQFNVALIWHFFGGV